MKHEEFRIDFIGIGAQRSATTWITECLREHPGVCVARPKEINFFGSSKYQKGLNWYKKHFLDRKKGQALGDYTSTYIYSPIAARRIKEHFPEVKIIVSLRNPIDRFISHTFKGLKKEEKIPSNFLETNQEAVEKGLYYSYLNLYFDLFSPENILVMIYEDIEKDPVGFMRRIYEFIEVNPSFVSFSTEKIIHASRRQRSPFFKKMRDSFVNFLGGNRVGLFLKKIFLRTGGRNLFYSLDRLTTIAVEKDNLPVEMRERLKRIYREDTQKLENLIGRKLWKDISA